MANDRVAIWDGHLKFGRSPAPAEVLYGNGADFTLTPINTMPYVAKSTNYTLTALDAFVDCTGTITISLPTASGIAGRYYVIKNSGTGTLTIDPAGSETIDGETTWVSAVQYEAIWLVSDGTNWKVV